MTNFSTTIVFGEQASKRYADGETNDEKLNEYGSVQTFWFTTERERDSFLAGVDAANGWLDYTIKEEEPVDA
ncbi:hypothetical protein AKJ29_02260 [Aliiroseovarius crassostreae]|uniref:Uncharacterized protein n=1 Tax=Aliiroseovarius crassostreae TaxID=154981 RepID=A0A0P7I217_9RHOB|nr:hypothetical protein [Aliiroseovarius crassostreae]KPN62992.1 hypothetical protein AKJ29_02260 [Aliiroseovarius crassostreae]